MQLNGPLVGGVHTVYLGRTISGIASTAEVASGIQVLAANTVSTNYGQSTNGTGSVNFSFPATTLGWVTVTANASGVTPVDTDSGTVNVVGADVGCSTHV
ncbi:MAG: hypothetical protein ABI210_01920 [Abditibacteriaceae bacterium]